MTTTVRADSTALASFVRPLWRLLEERRIEPERIFRDAGLDPSLLGQPRERYNVQRVCAAWVKAAALIDDPAFGLRAAQLTQATDFHALGYAFLASSTLRTAFERVVRFHRVVNESVSFQLHDAGENATLAYSTQVPELLEIHSIEDARLATVVGISRAICGDSLNPLEVNFFHPPKGDPGAYYHFFRCPITFASGRSDLTFRSVDLDQPLLSSNGELAQANEKILSGLIDNIRLQALTTNQVEAAIINALPSGTPTDDDIATALHLSPRTLQRKLSKEGTSFSQLLDAVRRKLAEKYILDPSLSMGEISYLLGFSELSTFSRAFKRWTGEAPSAARRKESLVTKQARL